eukprot:TRINITY_DN4469_c0_g1_i1.p1 TRINITY_DN4469_c0_g1~~TRINITY_DN4469_c0_g1_i1.p1  ORF type:complete len:130 (-),score=27.03 TRINITY_DN4469_c0_g1_i1:100-489(-)
MRTDQPIMEDRSVGEKFGSMIREDPVTPIGVVLLTGILLAGVKTANNPKYTPRFNNHLMKARVAMQFALASWITFQCWRRIPKSGKTRDLEQYKRDNPIPPPAFQDPFGLKEKKTQEGATKSRGFDKQD